MSQWNSSLSQNIQRREKEKFQKKFVSSGDKSCVRRKQCCPEKNFSADKSDKNEELK